MSSRLFKKGLLASSVAMVLGTGLSMPLYAAEEEVDKSEEEKEKVITITGIRGSLKASINTKRFSDAVIDSVTAEDIGKLPDVNVADSLSRIPGIAVSKQFGEGATVSIRGASNQFTVTNVNGQNVASTGWYSQQSIDRSFNFSMLPSELVAGMDVYKSSQANIVEGGVGGTVEIRTHKPLDLDSGTVFGSVRAQTETGSGETDPQISGLVSWKNDNDTFGVLVAAASQVYNLERKGQEALIVWGGRVADVNFRQERERTAYDVTMQFAPNDKLDFTLHHLNLELGADGVNTASWVPQATGFLDGPLCDATVPTNNPTDPTPICVLSSTSLADGQQPFWDVRPRNATMTSETTDFKMSYKGDNVVFSAQLGTTAAEGGTSFETNYGILSIDPQFAVGTIDGRGDRYIIDTNGYGPGDLPTSGNYAGWEGLQTGQVVSQPNEDEETYAQIDLDFDVSYGALTKIETGIRSTDHDVTLRQFRGQFANGVTYPDAADWASGTLEAGLDGRQIPAPDVGAMIAHTNANLTGWAEDFSSYATLNEKNTSVYVMGSFEGDGVRGNFGLRYIDTEVSSDFYVPSISNGNLVYDGTIGTAEADYDDVLPSMNLVLEVAEDVNIRMSAAKVITRPNYDDLFSNMGFAGNPDNVPGNESITVGNVALLPFSATQSDLGFEYYYNDSSMLSVAYFYKNVENFTRLVPQFNQSIGMEAIDLQGVPVDQLPAGCSSADCWQVNSFVNASGGTIEGLEFQLMHDFGDGWGGVFNYTYTDARTDPANYADGNGVFSDSSDHYLNLVGYYETDDYSVRAAYNWRSEYMVRETGFYAQRLHDDIGTLDITGTYNFSDSLSLVGSIVNALGADDHEYGNDNVANGGYSGAPRFAQGIPVSTYERDTIYTIGLNFTF